MQPPNGYDLGDRMMSQVARLLQRAFRRQDVVSRWDGAEFIIGISSITRDEGMKWLTDVLQSIEKKKFVTVEDTIQLTFRVGVAEYPQDGTTLEDLYKKASLLMVC